MRNFKSATVWFGGLICVAAALLGFPMRTHAQEGQQIAWPNPGWVPFHQGLMTTKVTTIYGPTPLVSGGCTWTPAPMSTQSSGALSQQTAGPNSCLDANSASAVAAIWGPYPHPNTTMSPSAIGPTPEAPCTGGCGWGAGLGKIDVYLGGNFEYEHNIFQVGKESSQGYPVYYSYSTDPLYCIPKGTEQYSQPSRFVFFHVPTYALPETDADHHLAIFDTAFNEWVFMEKAGVARTTAGLGGCGGSSASYMPFIGFPEGVFPNPSPTALPPFGTPPPNGSAGTSDAFIPGVEWHPATYGAIQTPSAITPQGNGSWGEAGSLVIAWVDQARDFVNTPYYPQHAGLLYMRCNTFTGSEAVPGSGSYVYPTVPGRNGYATDRNNYCYDNTKAIIYGGHLWLDTPPANARGTDGCDLVTWGIMQQLYIYGDYKNTTGQPIYCAGAGLGCSEDSVAVAISPDIEDTFDGSGLTNNYTCNGGTAQCTDTTTNPSPWFEMLNSGSVTNNLYTINAAVTGPCSGSGYSPYQEMNCGDLITYQPAGSTPPPSSIPNPGKGDRVLWWLPGQSVWTGSTYQGAKGVSHDYGGGITEDYGVACGVQLSAHLHVLRAPPATY